MIITIIVMMILVGVTVAVVMQGGLFDKATIAVIKQETATMQEYIVTKGADMLADKAKDGDELNVTVEEILREKYSMTLTEVNFETTPDYISNVDADPEGICYLLDASKLNVDSSRGNGTIETGKDIFVVDSNKRVYYVIEGKIGQGGDIPEDISPEETAPEALLDYILGVKDETTGKRPGRELADIFSIQGGFINIPEELQTGNLIGNLRFITRSAVSTEVVTKTDTEGNTTYEEGINMDFYFTYEGIRYKFRAITNQYGTEGLTLAKVGVKDLSYDTTSKVGKYVSYDNKYWIILYDDSENGLQMISSDVIKDENGRAIEYYLGDGDSTFTEDEVIEIDGVTSEKSDLEKTMYSYSNAVTTLNTICEGLVTPKEGVIKGVRCVGSNPITPNEDNSKAFIGSKDTIVAYNEESETPITWFEDNLNLQLNKTQERTYYTIKGTDPAQEYSIKDTDLNYEKDFDRMVALGINAKDDSYWLASRIITTEASRVGFNMRCELWGDGGGCELLRVLSEKVNCTSFGEAVRPVVILEQGALEGLTGDGLTWGTAYKIETPESPEEPVDPDPEEPVVPEEPSETDATEILDIGATINEKAPSSTNPFIPAGFKAVNTATSSWNATNTPDTENGLVIADANKNQFVWVPVSNINEMAMCKTCGSSANSLNTQTAQCTNCGENTILIGKLYNGSTVIEYSDSGSREPVALTSAGETTDQTQYENNYKAMVESVAKYGGFYIGRYETSASSTGIAQSKKSTDENVIVSANASTNGSWAGLYSLQRTYTTDSVQSEMIWGSQYDAMVRWLGTTAANSGYNQTRNPGTAPGDLIKNIYDIYGNSYEWTQEAYSTNVRTERGGDNASGGSLAIDYRCTGLGGYAYITSTFVDNGSRMTLYIIEETE